VSQNTAISHGVSFRFIESDFSCGPGEYELSSLTLALRLATGVAQPSALSSSFASNVKLGSQWARRSRTSPDRRSRARHQFGSDIRYLHSCRPVALLSMPRPRVQIPILNYTVTFTTTEDTLWHSVSGGPLRQASGRAREQRPRWYRQSGLSMSPRGCRQAHIAAFDSWP